MKKSNVYIQRDLSTCGACSIASIVSYYGGYVPLYKIVEDTLTTKTGTNAYNIKEALKKYGFNAYGIKIDMDHLDKKFLPVIAHTVKNGLEHFLVIYDFDDSSVITMDPSIGKKIYSKSDFKEIFTNQVIIINPAGKIVKMRRKRSLKELFIKEYKLEFKTILLYSIMSIIILNLSIVISIFIKLVYKFEYPYKLYFTMIFLIIIKLFILILREKKETNFLVRFHKKINDILMSHIFNLKIRYLNNKRVGEIIRKINDLNYIRDWFISITLVYGLDVFIIIFTSIALLAIPLKTNILVLIGIVLNILISVISSKKLYMMEKLLLDTYNEYTSDLTEYLEGIESIKNLNKEEYFKNELNNNFSTYLNSSANIKRYTKMIEYIKDAVNMLIFISISFIFVVNGYKLIDFITFNALYSILNSSLNNIINLIPSFIHVKTIFSDTSEFLDIKGENKKKTLQEPIKSIEIKNLSYSYDNYYMTINNANIHIKSNDKILIKGSSGIGKSTLARCISLMYDDYSGKILVNGKNIKDYSAKSLRDKILYIGQNEKLFKGTIRENITLGNMSNEISDVLDISLVNEIVDKKYSNLDFLLLENASNLSGGEKARVILARALYKHPEVLIIDEVLSALEESDENRILDMLLNQSNLTLIYITHRDKKNRFDKILEFRKDGIYETLK